MSLDFSQNSALHSNSAFISEALDLFKRQFEIHPPYKNYCLSLNISPETLDSWKQIPALPTDIFKINNPLLTVFTKAEPAEVFYTSGTTSEQKGTHAFPEVETYEKSILTAWEELQLPDRSNLTFLSQTKCESPHSSLVHMFETMRLSANLDTSRFLINADGEIDLNTLKETIEEKEPIGLCGTALAFLHLLEKVDILPLPTGSWILETGGYKGTKHALSKEKLYKNLSSTFNINLNSIINEYSMTELSSQFYTTGIGNPHKGPTWTRVRVIDPETNADVAVGEAGYLIIYDLANIHSLLAIRTQDIAIRTEDDRTFHLIGRDPKAIARGCSRASDETLSQTL